tara:strand:- start:502 stop:849 length:348 start_codon:yes stop_codon:yes gene_type:complete
MAMRLTKQKLVKIINEELENILAEAEEKGLGSSEFRAQGIETQKSATTGGIDANERKTIQDMYAALVNAAKATKLEQGRLGGLLKMVQKELEKLGYTSAAPDAAAGQGQPAKPTE